MKKIEKINCDADGVSRTCDLKENTISVVFCSNFKKVFFLITKGVSFKNLAP